MVSNLTELQDSVTKYEHSKAYAGYTLFAPLGGTDVWLIDMLGTIVHSWKMPYKPGIDAALLPNGNLLFAGQPEASQFQGLEGCGGVLIEVDWNANIVWKYEDIGLHHTFYRAANGNTLIVKWIETPTDIAKRVKGGIQDPKPSKVLFSDCIQEIDIEGKLIWEWVAFEHLDPDVDSVCPLCQITQWPGINALSVMPDGNILTSFQRTHNLAMIDKSTGKISWRWGKGEIAHQNASSLLENGNILFFDNGLHCDHYPMGFSRVIEVNPQRNDMVWSYEDLPRSNFFSSVLGGCQRLPNGNTLICESTAGRIFEVTPQGSIVWEFTNPFFFSVPGFGRSNVLYQAYRYGFDYEGLEGNILPSKKAEQKRDEGTAEVKKVTKPQSGEAVRKRLESLGY